MLQPATGIPPTWRDYHPVYMWRLFGRKLIRKVQRVTNDAVPSISLYTHPHTIGRMSRSYFCSRRDNRIRQDVDMVYHASNIWTTALREFSDKVFCYVFGVQQL